MIGPGACLLPPRRVWPDVKVSVLMPVYNVERFLPQALDSILGQTHRNFDVVLINDGSTDGTAAICRHYAEQDSRILLFDHAENRGLVWCLNFGLDHCDGTYVARADGDDWYFPGRFQDQIAAMEEGGLIATSGAYIVIDDDGTLLRLQTVHNRRPDLDHIPVRERYLPHPFLMVRRDAIGQVGGYRHVVHSEDTDLYYRLSELGEIRNLPAVLGHYRIHPTSISGASVANGRVQAVSSQLAALSAKLRAAGTSDIENWEEIAATVTRERDDFQSMMAALRPKLPPLREADACLFEAQCAAKFLQQEAWRPYVMTPKDARHVRAVVRQSLRLPSVQRNRMLRVWGKTLWRKLRGGDGAAVLGLLDPRLLVLALVAHAATAPRIGTARREVPEVLS